MSQILMIIYYIKIEGRTPSARVLTKRTCGMGQMFLELGEIDTYAEVAVAVHVTLATQPQPLKSQYDLEVQKLSRPPHQG